MAQWLRDWIAEALAQARNAAPVVAASVWGWFGDNLDMITKLTLWLYATLQVAYLVWKWAKERKNGAGKQS